MMDYVESIARKIQRRYPQVVCLPSDQVYGDEDVDLDVYAPRDKLLEVERYAHKVALKETEHSGYFILPSVAPLELCPVKPA